MFKVLRIKEENSAFLSDGGGIGSRGFASVRPNHASAFSPSPTVSFSFPLFFLSFVVLLYTFTVSHFISLCLHLLFCWRALSSCHSLLRSFAACHFSPVLLLYLRLSLSILVLSFSPALFSFFLFLSLHVFMCSKPFDLWFTINQKACNIKSLKGIGVLERACLQQRAFFLWEHNWIQWRSQVFNYMACLSLVNTFNQLNEDYCTGWAGVIHF